MRHKKDWVEKEKQQSKWFKRLSEAEKKKHKKKWQETAERSLNGTLVGDYAA